MKEALKKWACVVPFLLIAIVLVLMPWFLPQYRAETYVAVMALFCVEIMLIGWVINGRAIGAFIDNRNRISLSKLQAGAWTVIVLSGLATAAAFNAAALMFQGNSVTALSVTLPGELLLAMGISATSLVATPALLSIKSQETPKADAEDKAKAALNDPNISSTGKVLNKAAPEDASWSDLVQGDELGNSHSPDLGKIQQLFVTLLLIGIYIAYVYADLAGGEETVHSLPALDQSFVWLMGISHASYLAYKAAPHTASEPGK